jgi:HK97 family phage prohead protease
MAATILEVRDDDGEGITLSGYASTFDDPYDMGWYTETVAAGAFKRTLGRKPDVRLLLNHGGLPLARTTSKTLTLDTDAKGLRVSANLDPSDPDVAAMIPKMKRGDLNQMSFAFRVDSDMWEDDFSKRTLRDLDLDNGDVSVVTYPANPNATVGLRAAGVTVEPITSALSLLESRGASDAEVVAVLTRALAHFRGDSPTLEAVEETPELEQEDERAALAELEERLRIARSL